jgi:hypothetical protein
MIKFSNYFFAASISVAIVMTGCARKQDETAKKLEEMQKELDATKKQLESASQQAQGVAGSAAKQAGQASGKAADAAQSAADAQAAAEEAKRAAAPPPSHTLAAGTPIAVRTLGEVSTKTSANGSLFEATLAEPLVVDGYVVAPRGASVEGVVTNSDPGGKVKGVASITVGLRSISMADGRRLAVKTSGVSQDAASSKKKDAAKIGITTGIGAAIGAIAGGGKGAAIGAGAGAAGGTGVVMATRGNPAVIPAESPLTFKLSAPVTVQELKK